MDIQPQLMLGTLFTLEGEVARADGLAASCNPYREGTEQHANWLRGWLTPDALPELSPAASLPPNH